MGKWLRRAWIGAAAACLFVALALLVFEESGVCTRLVRERLAQELGTLGNRLALEHVELHWFEPGLTLHGLALRPESQAGANDLQLERVHVHLWRTFDGVRSVAVEGGRVLLGPRLFQDWNRAAVGEPGKEGAPLRLPLVHVADLELGLELPDRSCLELGSLTLAARSGASAEVELAGRLAPSVAGAIVAPDPIRWSGRLAPSGLLVWASARDLALATRALAGGTLVRALPISEGSALLTLDARFELAFGETPRTSGHLRARLADGRVGIGKELARLSDLEIELEDLGVDLEVDLRPTALSDTWMREAWEGRAGLTARANGVPLWAQAVVGRAVEDGAWVHAWGRLSDLPLDPAALGALGIEAGFGFVRAMLDPRGRLELAANARVGHDERGWTRDLVLQARSLGDVQLAYLGFPGEPKTGLALPLEKVRGELVFGERTRAAHPWRLAALDLSAEHGSGTVHGWTQVTAPSTAAGAFPLPEFDLLLETPTLAVNRRLLDSLQENHALAWIEPDFQPRNGVVSAAFRVHTAPELSGTSAHASLGLKGLALRWQGLQVPMEEVDGHLELRWAAEPSVARDQPHLTHRALGVAYDLDNRQANSEHGARARVQGWVRELPLPRVFEAPLPPSEFLQEVRVDIDNLKLRGDDFEILAKRFPTLERQVRVYGVVGTAHVRFTGSQSDRGQPFRSAVQVTPLGMDVFPQFFQRKTRDLRGHVLIESEDSPAGERNSAQLVLSGTWPGGVELIAQARIPEEGEGELFVYGSGIDPSNTSFKGALITTLADDPANPGGIDLSSWTLEGPVDLAATTRFDPAGSRPPVNHYVVQLRDNDFRAEDLVLNNLYGTLQQDGEVLTSPRIEATRAGHALEFRALYSFPIAIRERVPAADSWLKREGFWQDERGRALQADLFTRDFPLDAEHLKGCVQPELLAELAANPQWRGALDVLGARLLVTNEADNRGKIALRGALRPHDLSLRLGLPIQVETADVALQELVLEAGRLRGWAEVTSVEARIAERRLSNARSIAGYVDGRLTIDNLSGEFEGGRLESLGGAGGVASKALGIDLAEPHRFDVAMELSQVNVGGLLRGVFQSSIADEGVLDASLQLSGTPSEILALSGRGSLSLDEGALWSIPVIRALFVQLGFDKGGLFDRLRSRFELRDGRVQVSHLEIRSSLLDLVGQGWQDLDGELCYDLEVRYSLLDKLGILGRMLYWLNNNLMRVAVRGDFERPSVFVRNALVELFSGFEDRPDRHLPLPDFSTLGSRF